jgi:hypothetical protein
MATSGNLLISLNAPSFTHGEELEVPVGDLRTSQAISIPIPSSSFREAECTAIIGALKAEAGRIAAKGGAAERLGLSGRPCKTKFAGSALQKRDTRT